MGETRLLIQDNNQQGTEQNTEFK